MYIYIKCSWTFSSSIDILSVKFTIMEIDLIFNLYCGNRINKIVPDIMSNCPEIASTLHGICGVTLMQSQSK